MQELTGLLEQAAALIEPNFFLLPLDGAPPRYRERVYCYELYHQLRQQWPNGCQYSLNGEVDKRRHPYFAGTHGHASPDLLVHVPGSPDNYAVIEVKSVMASDRGIRKDLRTLIRFRGFGYQRAIYLWYGMNPGDVLQRVQHAGATAEELASLEIWVHSQVGVQAERIH